MKKFRVVFLLFFFVGALSAQKAVTLKGEVYDEGEYVEVIAADIILKKNGDTIAVTQSDFDGLYSFTVPPDEYDMEVSYVGLPKLRIFGLVLPKGVSRTYDIRFPKQEEGEPTIELIEIRAERPNFDEFRAEDIRYRGYGRDPNEAIPSVIRGDTPRVDPEISRDVYTRKGRRQQYRKEKRLQKEYGY